jgi:hypothetical protein
LLITDTVKLVVPELVTVTGSVLVEPTLVDGKLRPVVESVTVGAFPFPLSVTVFGDPVALSVMFRVAEYGPTAAGVKLTWMVQELPGVITCPPQLLVWLKLVGFTPLKPISFTVILVLPSY